MMRYLIIFILTVEEETEEEIDTEIEVMTTKRVVTVTTEIPEETVVEEEQPVVEAKPEEAKPEVTILFLLFCNVDINK